LGSWALFGLLKQQNNELVQGGMHIPTVQGIFIGSFTQSPKPTKVPTTRKGKTTEHDDVLTLKWEPQNKE
jgi:hypothetical protein